MPFLTDRGLGLDGISLLKGWVGNAMSIVGALMGGWLAFSTGRRNALLISGIGQVASFTLYVAIALGVGGIGLLWVATIAEGVLGTMATVALFALMMDASDPEHAGTDYTLLACVVLLVGMLANLCGGRLADAFGYATAFTTRRDPRVARLPGTGLGPGPLSVLIASCLRVAQGQRPARRYTIADFGN